MEETSANLAHLSLRSNELTEGGFAAGNEEDKSRSNPWKLITSTENNILESDVWPEPSSDGQMRQHSIKPIEEKPKRKLKWQSYDCEPSSSGSYRGRGKYLSTPTSGIQMSDASRRGLFEGPCSPPCETQDFRARYPSDGSGRSMHRYRTKCGGVFIYLRDHQPGALCPTEKNDGFIENSGLNGMCTVTHLETPVSVMQQTSPRLDGTLFTGSNNETRLTAVRKDFSNDRLPSTEAGDVISGQQTESGAVRDSIQTFQSLGTMDSNHSSIHPFPISGMPLPGFHSIPYCIPGMDPYGNVLLGPSLQIPPKPNMVHPMLSRGTPISMAPTNQHASLQVSVTPDVDQPQADASRYSIHPKMQVVDVADLVIFVNDLGWENVTFPNGLKNHPVVANAIRHVKAQTGADPVITPGITEEESKSPNDSGDVIVTKSNVYFVPRNANRSKFLKFLSKADYIRHHVEYYFSELNLQRDSHLASILAANNGVCPASTLVEFNRLRWAGTTENELLDSISKSSTVKIVGATVNSSTGVARNTLPIESACAVTEQLSLTETPNVNSENPSPQQAAGTTTPFQAVVSNASYLNPFYWFNAISQVENHNTSTPLEGALTVHSPSHFTFPLRPQDGSSQVTQLVGVNQLGFYPHPPPLGLVAGTNHQSDICHTSLMSPYRLHAPTAAPNLTSFISPNSSAQNTGFLFQVVPGNTHLSPGIPAAGPVFNRAPGYWFPTGPVGVPQFPTYLASGPATNVYGNNFLIPTAQSVNMPSVSTISVDGVSSGSSKNQRMSQSVLGPSTTS